MAGGGIDFMDSKKELLKILDNLEIQYTLYDHNEVFTIDDINSLHIKFEGQYCKNLFLKNSRGNKHYLVIIKDSKKADLKQLARAIGSTRLSFAEEESLYKYLRLKPGSVTPFGLINDEQKEIIVLLDSELVGLDKINFHPNINTATVTVSYEGLNRFLQWRNNRVEIAEI